MCANIDDFNRGCALIMGRLYSTFPKKSVVKITELDDGPVPPSQETLETYSATLDFLAEEEYIRFGSQAGPEKERVFMAVRLTSKGLAALNRNPDALDAPKSTVGSRVAAWSAGTIAGVASDAVRHAVAVILG
ncbi:MAG: hypothetical protein RBR42_05030 [Desulfomicrobium sp.]|nr:hypothetical protein [Desulfomicrobium sp.]